MGTAAAPRSDRRAAGTWRVSVRGVVQGVGFRPFVHRLALRCQLTGWVRNEAGTVEIVLGGSERALDEFLHALRSEAPPLAHIATLDVVQTAEPAGESFRIVSSRDDAVGRQPISPDVATCAACERELYDPTNRRAQYPFITCTDCGPRHSVIQAMPYDRERTTMTTFTQCAECLREYCATDDRRYHSETNSCPGCGPRVLLLSATGETMSSAAPIEHAARLLSAGATVAVRGIGGFHLAADATCESAVRRLRDRKHRDGKPLAVMVRSLAAACSIAQVSPAEAAWLLSAARPIVVLRLREHAAIARAVSDGLPTVGVMLAYSPLHMLLLDRIRGPLVMTSGNPTSIPLAFTLEQALTSLQGIADAFLTHDREIAAPIDDSVMRIVDGEPVLLRRARGFAPLPVPLPVPAAQPILAVGAHLKNTFALADGGDAFVSQHIGDLETLETMEHCERSVEAFTRMLRIEPAVAVRDLHPEYLSSRFAQRLGLRRTLTVQHHHAHVAAVMAEHGVTERVIGLAFDGTGFGDDGCIWGGEFLVADLAGYTRAGQLRYAPLPGGDAAARQGWRAAVGYASLGGVDGRLIEYVLNDIPPDSIRIARQQCERRLNAPLASSTGRLFDAAAALLGICTNSRFEGEAAMHLEMAAGAHAAAPIPCPVEARDGRAVLDPVPLLIELAARRIDGEDSTVLAAGFHESLACAAAELAVLLAEREHVRTVVLGGGVFQNGRLLSSVSRRVRDAGLHVLTAAVLPPNDGAISYGQAAIAAAQLANGGAS
jgi:hydrogenase maturation protein HypF